MSHGITVYSTRERSMLAHSELEASFVRDHFGWLQWTRCAQRNRLLVQCQ